MPVVKKFDVPTQLYSISSSGPINTNLSITLGSLYSSTYSSILYTVPSGKIAKAYITRYNDDYAQNVRLLNPTGSSAYIRNSVFINVSMGADTPIQITSMSTWFSSLNTDANITGSSAKTMYYSANGFLHQKYSNLGGIITYNSSILTYSVSTATSIVSTYSSFINTSIWDRDYAYMSFGESIAVSIYTEFSYSGFFSCFCNIRKLNLGFLVYEENA